MQTAVICLHGTRVVGRSFVQWRHAFIINKVAAYQCVPDTVASCIVSGILLEIRLGVVMTLHQFTESIIEPQWLETVTTDIIIGFLTRPRTPGPHSRQIDKQLTF
jgi:hypothetical protein